MEDVYCVPDNAASRHTQRLKALFGEHGLSVPATYKGEAREFGLLVLAELASEHGPLLMRPACDVILPCYHYRDHFVRFHHYDPQAFADRIYNKEREYLARAYDVHITHLGDLLTEHVGEFTHINGANGVALRPAVRVLYAQGQDLTAYVNAHASLNGENVLWQP
jgi:hypothetical protein